MEIKQGEPNVYGIADKKKEAIDCPIITEQLLNYPPKNRMFLKFPLTLKKSWSHRYQNRQGRWRDSAMEVVAWEKVGTSKGEFDTFKIERSRGRRGVSRFYYYSPKARAIVLHKVDSRTVRRKVTLIDFKVR